MERIITETEKRIIKKRMEKKITPDKVFSLCGVQTLSDVYKNCGGKAAILYHALVGNSSIAGMEDEFKLLSSFLTATGLNKSDLSRATTKLESTGYIVVDREPGHKNLFKLTPKGRKGLVDRK